MKSFLEVVATAAITAAKEIKKKIEIKILRMKPVSNESQSLKSEKQVLHDRGTEQVGKALRASLAVHTY